MTRPGVRRGAGAGLALPPSAAGNRTQGEVHGEKDVSPARLLFWALVISEISQPRRHGSDLKGQPGEITCC